MVADQADTAFGVEMVAVEADDAGGFLAAMLEGVEAERGQRRGVGMVEDAEDAALLMQAVLFEPSQALIVSLKGVGHARPRLP